MKMKRFVSAVKKLFCPARTLASAVFDMSQYRQVVAAPGISLCLVCLIRMSQAGISNLYENSFMFAIGKYPAFVFGKKTGRMSEDTRPVLVIARLICRRRQRDVEGGPAYLKWKPMLPITR
jgi:hypothetical protein